MDTTRGAVNLGEGVNWKCMALVATGFFCCVGTLGRPVANMQWVYLVSKNK